MEMDRRENPREERRELIRLPYGIDRSLEDQLHESRFILDSKGDFHLRLRDGNSNVLVLVTPESSGAHFGILIEARPHGRPNQVYALGSLAVDVFPVGEAPEEPIESMPRAPHQICCGPFKRDTEYIILVPRPPPVLRLPRAPQEWPTAAGMNDLRVPEGVTDCQVARRALLIG